jgi:hypothetical protein
MKKLIIISLLCAFNTLAGLSQTSDQIVLIKRHYFLNDKQLNSKELKTLLKSEQGSALIYKKVTTNNTIGAVFCGIGLAFIIYAVTNPPAEMEGPLPGLVSDEEMNKHLIPLYIGAGCVVMMLPFILSGNSQFKKSITLYNSKHTTGYNGTIKLDLGITKNGVGMICKF